MLTPSVSVHVDPSGSVFQTATPLGHPDRTGRVVSRIRAALGGLSAAVAPQLRCTVRRDRQGDWATAPGGRTGSARSPSVRGGVPVVPGPYIRPISAGSIHCLLEGDYMI